MKKYEAIYNGHGGDVATSGCFNTVDEAVKYFMNILPDGWYGVYENGRRVGTLHVKKN